MFYTDIIKVCAFAVAGLGLGIWLLPQVADRFLHYKYAQRTKDFDGMCSQLEGWSAANGGRRPEKSRTDDESDLLAYWCKKQEQACVRGNLTRERYERLKKDDAFDFEGKMPAERCESEAELEKRFAFPATARNRAVCGISLGTASGVCAYATPALAMVLMAAMLSCLAMTTITDVRVRMIPFEASWAALAVAVVYQLARSGPMGLLYGLAAAAGTLALFWVTKALCALVGSKQAVGTGDMKLIVPVAIAAGYPGICYGLIVMLACMLLYSVGGIVARKMTHKSTFPMSPFMAVCMVAAVVGPAIAGV